MHDAKHTKKNVGQCSRITLVLEDRFLGRERQMWTLRRLSLLLCLGKLELIISGLSRLVSPGDRLSIFLGTSTGYLDKLFYGFRQ